MNDGVQAKICGPHQTKVILIREDELSETQHRIQVHCMWVFAAIYLFMKLL